MSCGSVYPERVGGVWGGGLWGGGGHRLRSVTNNACFETEMGASLVVHWLRLHAPNARDQVQCLVRELDPASHN